MARGWESKEVESQIEAAEERAALSKRKQIGADQVRLERERESLELSHTRVLRDLSSATNPKYRDQLQRSLEHLNQKLAALKSANTPDRPE